MPFHVRHRTNLVASAFRSIVPYVDIDLLYSLNSSYISSNWGIIGLRRGERRNMARAKGRTCLNLGSDTGRCPPPPFSFPPFLFLVPSFLPAFPFSSAAAAASAPSHMKSS